jgi:hypothetical protein
MSSPWAAVIQHRVDPCLRASARRLKPRPEQLPLKTTGTRRSVSRAYTAAPTSRGDGRSSTSPSAAPAVP